MTSPWGRGHALAAGEGVTADVAVKASAASTNGALTLIDSQTDGGAPPRVHQPEDEAMFVVDGRMDERDKIAMQHGLQFRR